MEEQQYQQDVFRPEGKNETQCADFLDTNFRNLRTLRVVLQSMKSTGNGIAITYTPGRISET